MSEDDANQDDSGIGIWFKYNVNGNLIVAALTRNGPAARSGKVHVGDGLVEIDRIGVRGKTQDQVTSMLIGVEGSLIELGLLRAGGSTLNRVELKRVTFGSVEDRDKILPKSSLYEQGIMGRESNDLFSTGTNMMEGYDDDDDDAHEKTALLDNTESTTVDIVGNEEAGEQDDVGYGIFRSSQDQTLRLMNIDSFDTIDQGHLWRILAIEFVVFCSLTVASTLVSQSNLQQIISCNIPAFINFLSMLVPAILVAVFNGQWKACVPWFIGIIITFSILASSISFRGGKKPSLLQMLSLCTAAFLSSALFVKLSPFEFSYKALFVAATVGYCIAIVGLMPIADAVCHTCANAQFIVMMFVAAAIYLGVLWGDLYVLSKVARGHSFANVVKFTITNKYILIAQACIGLAVIPVVFADRSKCTSPIQQQ